jgi:hypothetical protein
MNRSVPLPGCWWVTDNFLAGPAPFESYEEVMANIAALERADIRMMISLVSIYDFYSDPEEAEAIAWEFHPRFAWLGFALVEGEPPPNDLTMEITLGWINAGLLEGDKVFVHAKRGEGRVATVIACWLLQRGLVQGEEVFGRIDQLRGAAGLSVPCPFTLAQRQFVSAWKKKR